MLRRYGAGASGQVSPAVLVYDRGLSDAERQQVEDDLQQKYGV
jgi:hypothetical protein